MISSVRNFTISEVGQAAVLECSVSNTEGNGLKVWVNWTTSTNGTLREEHVTFRKGNVFYLILTNASAGDYICWVFSTHSVQFPEDCKTATVAMKGYIAAITFLFLFLFQNTPYFLQNSLPYPQQQEVSIQNLMWCESTMNLIALFRERFSN